MKKFVLVLAILIPSLSQAIGESDMGAEAAIAANLVLQPAVSSCLQKITQGQGQIFISELINVQTVDGNQYFLSGSTRFGDVMAGQWSVQVDEESRAEEGASYTCKVLENME